MDLKPGRRLGIYEVLAAIGSGGMGEVYRARDTKLNRDVALKILPEQFALDADRLARFKREAQLLASLNHPNIAAIYGFEESGGVHALVLELVEGPTLADRIAQGPTPLDEALPIAKQIAEALETAHEQGIIHRDLKPANIKVRVDGTVKVLDFGLAKALDPASRGIDASQSPTITRPAMTRTGVILGTAAYMSPEQAKGRSADRRSDIWAFGCVLYEMVSGQSAFAGETISDTIARILEREPDWQVMPGSTPAKARDLLRRCLQKDPHRRLHDIADARIDLEEALAEPASTSAIHPVPAARITRRPLFVGAACLVAGALGAGLVTWTLRPEASPALVARFAVTLSPGEIVHPTSGGNSVAISRDGSRVAVVGNSNGRTQIYVRSVGELSTKAVPGTEAALAPSSRPTASGWPFDTQAAVRSKR